MKFHCFEIFCSLSQARKGGGRKNNCQWSPVGPESGDSSHGGRRERGAERGNRIATGQKYAALFGSSDNLVHRSRIGNALSRRRRDVCTGKLSTNLHLPGRANSPVHQHCQQERRQRSRGDLRSAGGNNLSSPLAELPPPTDQRTGNRFCLLSPRSRPLAAEYFFH